MTECMGGVLKKTKEKPEIFASVRDGATHVATDSNGKEVPRKRSKF